MGIQIEDGKGKGFVAQVDEAGHLRVSANVETELEHVSKEEGLAFSITNATYNYSAGDTVLGIKNQDADRNFHVDRIICSGDADTQVIIHVPTAEVTMGGTAVTEVNLNTNSGRTASMDSRANESGNAIAAGTHAASFFMLASTPYTVEFEGALILGTNEGVFVDFVGVGTGAVVTILGDFEDIG